VKALCPNCQAEGTLRQEVTVEFSTTRPVNLELKAGKAQVSYGWTDPSCGNEEITNTQGIECSRCKETWEDEKDLLGEKPHEHHCDSCDWWGFNPWQHGLERPDCGGTVRDRDALEAVA
jgi:hypothetical protein